MKNVVGNIIAPLVVLGMVAMTVVVVIATHHEPAPTDQGAPRISDPSAPCSLVGAYCVGEYAAIDVGTGEVIILVDDSLADGFEWKAGCPSMDGGTDDSCLKHVDGGVEDYKVTDYLIQNTSTTCVRVGFTTRVDQNHGAQVGDGCANGKVFPVHGKKCRCQSEGAKVVVDGIGGKP